MWIYRMINTDPAFEIGYFNPAGAFVVVDEYTEEDEAAQRVHYLNGGTSKK